MANNDLKRLIEALLEEGGPSPEHERLKADLTDWALFKGYSKAYKKFQNGSEPDVLRENPQGKYLFVGDAKNSENETADNSETLSRIQTYFKQFVLLLGPERYKGGILAVATNNENEANKWVPVLNTLARAACIVSGSGCLADFSVVKLDGKMTWIIYW